MRARVLFLKPDWAWNWTPVIVAYLWLLGEYPSFYVGHVVLEVGDEVYSVDEGGVSVTPATSWHDRAMYEMHVHVHKPWLEQVVTQAHFLGYRMKWWEYVTYPFTKTYKPVTCTGFIQHLLLLPVTNPTPYGLWLELSDDSLWWWGDTYE
jgi:hypothetical protein